MNYSRNSKKPIGDRYASHQDYSRDYSRDYPSAPASAATERYQEPAKEKQASTATENTIPSVLEPQHEIQTPVDQAATQKLESRGWSYLKACAVGYVSSMFFAGLILESPGLGQLFSHIWVNLVSGLAALAFAPVLIVPIRIMADVMRLFAVKRGISDVLIGALCGGLMMVPDIASGNSIRVMSICFVLGGAIGGFSYWRSRGYPTLEGRQMHVTEVVDAFKGTFK